MPNPVAMLKDDHERLRQLFSKYHSSESEEERKLIVNELLASLDTHAAIEEEIFYPAVREQTREELMMDKAREEHHAARVFILELARMQPGEPRYEAKLLVLQEHAEHHMQEEEDEILPRAEQMNPEWLEQMGQRMEQRWPGFRREAESMIAGGLMANAKGMFEQAKKSLGRG